MKSKQQLLPLTLFFFSGFSALIYEIVWSRLLTLVFGTSIEAISAVITAFMFGLALGSYFAGRHSDYIRKHLAAYGVSEILIGLSSIFLYYTIINFPFILKPVHQILSDRPGIIIFLTYGMNFLLVAIPTTLMGATFPLISKHYIRDKERTGLSIGVLYGVNTLGAVTGTFLCGFVLIPAIGVMATHHTAAIISIFIGFLALASSRGDRRESLLNLKPLLNRSRFEFSLLKDLDVTVLLGVFFVTGFVAMACEVVWTRLLVMVIGNSTYAFSSILTIFLGGIAAGSFFIAPFSDRIKHLHAFALIEALLCLYLLATLPFLDNLPFLYQFLYNNLYHDFASLEVITFLIVMTLIFIPTLLMGAAFPVAGRLIMMRIGVLGRSIGTIYSINTLGGIFGAFLAGFYLIPNLGIEKSLLLLTILNLAGAMALLFRDNYTGKAFKSSFATAAIAFLVFYVNWLPEWNKNYLTRGVYLYADWFSENFTDVNHDLKHYFDDRYKIKWFREGLVGTVSVTDIDGTLSFQINGKTEGSTSYADMKTQIMVAALPLMLKESAKDVAVIGLGTGMTLGVAEQFPVSSIDCIELSPAVVEASRFFSRINHEALGSPKLNLIMGDGRNYLTYTDKQYDVIINEPSNPWITGVSNLFTLEFFNIARDRLKKKGLMAQWVQLYSMDAKEVKTLLHTFETVFPHVSVWMFTPTDLIIIGSVDAELDHYGNIERAFYEEALYGDLRAIGIHAPRDVMAGYLFGTEKARRFAEGAPLNTDNEPIIEFEAPKSLFNPSIEENVAAMKRCC